MATEQEMRAVEKVVRDLRSPCVVDLGARCGEEESWIRAAFREAVHYVMVEAEMRNCQKILDGGITSTRRLILGAIAEHSGTTEFYGSVSDGGKTYGSGSIRKPLLHEQIFPDIVFADHLRTLIPCWSLDDVFDREWLRKIDLLWVDIQGAEKNMIHGGEKALQHTRYIFMETEDRELYEGMALKQDLTTMLNARGFQLLEEFEYNCLYENRIFIERKPR